MQATAPLTQLPPLIALRAISNGALKSDSLPTRIKLLNWGVNPSTQGDVTVDDTTIAAMSVNQRALGFDRVALDFSHNTVPGSPEFERTSEPRNVAAYGAPELIPGDGLYLSSITWTDSGKANAKNYEDLSPTPSLDAQRRVIFLHSAALVRNGAVFDLSFFSAVSPTEDGCCPTCGQPMPAGKTKPPTPMTAEIQTAITDALKPLTTQLTALAAEVSALKTAKPAAFETKVGDKTITLDAGSVAEKLINLEAQLATQAALVAESSKGAIILQFAEQGKAPLGADGKPIDDATLKTFSAPELARLLANTPATVPLSARGKPAKDGNKDNTLTGLDRAIASHIHEVAAR